MTSTEFRVTGMTCSHCEHAVSEEVGQIPGVEVSRRQRIDRPPGRHQHRTSLR